MIQSKKRRVAAFFLALAMALSLGACAGRPEANPDAVSSLSDVDGASALDTDNGGRLVFANPLPIPTQAAKGYSVDTGFLDKAKEKHAINSDTVGWLQIPNTKIDDVIVFYPGDRNSYYLRRDFDKVPNTGPLASQYGSYFADYRSKFEGGGQGLSRNTVIYGHSMEDNPDGGGFSQLKKYLDEDFAKKNPYVYFSTLDDDMAWEVFAVFYTTINFAYNKPDPSDSDFKAIIDDSIARSVHTYETEVTTSDKIITLSTCCYNFTTAYPNNYRYVVMAKLVPPGERLKTEVTLTKNPSPMAP